MYHAPVLWNIEFSSVLSETRVIAEAWDAAGLYQVGDFPGFRWGEWNGRYRDAIRRFVSGEPGLSAEHDGFTLYDLVSYNSKHNEGNGEQNRDGSNDNLSWNCGVEGDTTDAEILALRRQQVKNFMAILLLSQGIPMINAGDEVLRARTMNWDGLTGPWWRPTRRCCASHGS
jgi:glycogen operon protein